jgi:hypothetical protein
MRGFSVKLKRAGGLAGPLYRPVSSLAELLSLVVEAGWKRISATVFPANCEHVVSQYVAEVDELRTKRWGGALVTPPHEWFKVD